MNEPNPPFPRYSRLSWVLFAWLVLAVLLELYRFIHYGTHWQFLLEISTPWKTWLRFNLAFLLVVLGCAAGTGFLVRLPRAAEWVPGFLALSLSAGALRSLFLTTIQAGPSGVPAAVIQLAAAAGILVLLAGRRSWLLEEHA